MFWFIILLLAVGAGFYCYHKLMIIEREIRAEQEAAESQSMHQSEGEAGDSELDSEDEIVSAVVETADLTPLEASILAKVAEKPGLKQTDLYLLFADSSKKQLQNICKEMADRGAIKREKSGSSYLIYPC